MSIKTLKNIRRLNKIVVTLIRYGFGGLVSRMRIVPFISTLERIVISKKAGKLREPERIRLVLEDLGPTFIKLGQIASTRADLLAPEWLSELKKLQDMVPPFPFEDVRKVVENALGSPLENIFASFENEPVASASIAQVHLAELRDGKKVAVKVKRPGIERIIASDMSVMHTVAGLLERYVPQSRRFRPGEVVSEFERVITREQDFTIEGGNTDRFYNLFSEDPDIQIPRVWWDYTTSDVLTMERISGTPIDEAARIKAKGVDIKKVAVKGIEIFFRQVFDFGVFHADLHPGNIFVRDDGVIIYLDFGIIGRLDRGLRRYLASMLFYLIKKDYYRMALVHRDMQLIGDDVNLYEFEETLRDITEPIFGKTLEHIDISTLLMKLISTARRFNMRLQPNLLLLQKSMVIIEGVGRQLYPDINMWEVARPLISKWMIREKFSPGALFEKGSRGVEDLAGAALDIPVNMNSLIQKTLKEEVRIGFVHHRLEEVTSGLEAAGRSVAVGFLAGSIVVASALITLFAPEGGVKIFGLPVVSVIGFIIAFVLGVKVFVKGAGRGKG
ncbi:MAG: 2-polyprenylphenol 6-hydroxylase [Thermodesulfobacteriota bacterium]